MSLIDDIRKDREAGTPGPWRHSPWHIEEGPDAVYTPDNWLLCTTSAAENARRIARVPDLEAALLAAEELATRVSQSQNGVPHKPGWVEEALAAYREATS